MEPIGNPTETELKFEINKVHEGVHYDDYSDAPGMRSSGLKDLEHSPAHYHARHILGIARQPSTALEFGKVLHFAVLETEMFRDLAVIAPEVDKRTKAGKEAYADFLASQKIGAIIIRPEAYKTLMGMIQSIANSNVVSRMLKEGVRETSIWWNDEDTGTLCKCRPDFITSRGHALDIKTTRDGRVEYFMSRAIQYGYHLQAAHYTKGIKSAGIPKGESSFTFLAIEKEPPYAINPIALYRNELEYLWAERAKLMRLHKSCLEKNVWPAYEDTVKPAVLPKWYEYKLRDQELEGEINE